MTPQEVMSPQANKMVYELKYNGVSFPIRYFNGEQQAWMSWKEQIENGCAFTGLLDALEAKLDDSHKSKRRTNRKFPKNEDTLEHKQTFLEGVLTILTFGEASVKLNRYLHIKDATIATAWKSLVDEYTGNVDAVISQLTFQYLGMADSRLDESANLREHIVTLQNVEEKLRKLGAPPSEYTIRSILRRMIPHSYIRDYDMADPGLEEKYSALTKAYTLRADSGDLENTRKHNKAVPQNQAEHANQVNQSNGKPYNRDRPNKRTWHETPCSICGYNNHTTKECRRKFKGKRGDTNNPSSDVLAQIMTELKTLRTTVQELQARSAVDDLDEYLNVATDETRTPDTMGWNIDSGASSHFTPYKADFVDLDQEPGPMVTIADGTKIRTTGFGIVTCPVQTSKGKVKVMKMQAYYVPELRERLFSVHQHERDTTKDGKALGPVRFEGEHSHIMLVDGTKVPIKRSTKQYTLHMLGETPYGVNEAATTELWHRRMGHIHNELLHHTRKKYGVKCAHTSDARVRDTPAASGTDLQSGQLEGEELLDTHHFSLSFADRILVICSSGHKTRHRSHGVHARSTHATTDYATLECG